jgi:hypothetical protein
MAIANTTIQLRKSGATGNVPSSLNYGELALNYADGKLYYKNASGTITYISSGISANSFATINANSSLILATSNTDTLSIAPGNNITVTANTTSKTISIALANSVTIANSLTIGGGTGGSITGANSISANTFTTNNYIQFSDGTKQYTANAGGSATDTVARTSAQAAFNQANSAYSLASSASSSASDAYSLASTAYSSACNATVLAQAAYNQANTGGGGGPYIITGANYIDYGWIGWTPGPVQFSYGTL